MSSKRTFNERCGICENIVDDLKKVSTCCTFMVKNQISNHVFGESKCVGSSNT